MLAPEQLRGQGAVLLPAEPVTATGVQESDRRAYESNGRTQI